MKPSVDNRYVVTHHDCARRPGMVCALCWERIADGALIVGMPLAPGSPHWTDRVWHFADAMHPGPNCFKRKFPDRTPRDPRFTPLAAAIAHGEPPRRLAA